MGEKAAPRDICRQVIDAALEGVEPAGLVAQKLSLSGHVLKIRDRSFDLSKYRKIHVLGAGKGAYHLYRGIENVMSSYIAGGVIVCLREHPVKIPGLSCVAGSHPVPDHKSLAAGKAVRDYIDQEICGEDLVLFLLTGGASSLLVLPALGISFEDKVRVHGLLVNSNAPIGDINCVRKHMSAIKGGGLAQMLAPATVVSLIISDVCDSPLEDIGSGPSVGDSTSFAQARAVLDNYGLLERLESQVKDFFHRGALGQIPETLSPDSPLFQGNDHFLLAHNLTALNSARQKALDLGVPCFLLTSRDKGEAREAAKVYCALVKEILLTANPFSLPVLLLAGGELTVTLAGKGKGGRNQEFVLACLKELASLDRGFYIASLGSDGIDGPTDAAGAWIDGKTPGKVKGKNLDPGFYLKNNDSYHFFQQLGQLIRTGATHTNVADVRLFYLYE